MASVPKEIDGAKVIAHALVSSHVPTGKTTHIVDGEKMGPAYGLAICRYEDAEGYYLMRCDPNWEAVTDTWHETVEAAKQQAEFEYAGLNGAWRES